VILTHSTEADPGFLEGGANFRQQSLEVEMYSQYAGTRGSGGMPPRKILKIKYCNLGAFQHITLLIRYSSSECVNGKVLVDSYNHMHNYNSEIWGVYG